MMVWLSFAITAVVIVVAATQLARYGDVISIRTGMGGMFIGTILMSVATSLPELLTTISSINQAAPELAVGNLFGSTMFNMLMLAILDMMNRRVYILRSVAITHTLTASLAVLLTGLTVFFMMGDFTPRIGWVGLDSLVIILIYGFAVYLIQASNNSSAPPPEPTAAELAELPSLRNSLIGFGLATLALVIVTPIMVNNAISIAELTGLSTGFVGTTLVALVTSLPELVTTISAGRIGAYDLAVGNLFGSNIFNMFAVALADLFFVQGRFLSNINPSLTMAGVMGLILTTIGMIGILAHVERRRFFIQINIMLWVGYFVGMFVMVR